jgi:hypothetical protein
MYWNYHKISVVYTHTTNSPSCHTVYIPTRARVCACVCVWGTCTRVPLHTKKARTGIRLSLHSVLTSTLIAGEWITSGSDRFALVTHVIVGWMPPDSVCTFWRRINLFPCHERLPDNPARSVVTALTELSLLPRSVCVRLIVLSEHN